MQVSSTHKSANSTTMLNQSNRTSSKLMIAGPAVRFGSILGAMYIEKDACPQCLTEYNTSTYRKVNEVCGHSKCRQCVIMSDDWCIQCPQSGTYKVDNDHEINPISFNHINTVSRFQLESMHSDTKYISPVDASNTMTMTFQANDPESNPALEEPPDTNRSKDNDQETNDSVPYERKRRTPTLMLDHITVLSINGKACLYQCKVCQSTFQTKASISYHQYCATGNANKPFKCKQCGQGFIAKSHYEYHLRTHTGELPFTCPKCGRGFKQKSKVKRHMGSHIGDMVYKCDKCNSQFNSSQGLRCHTRTHMGESLFKCLQCKKCFMTATTLKRHSTSHIANNQFPCKHCDKFFRSKWAVRDHLLTHVIERPYACDRCSRAFAHRLDLKRHQVIHSGVRQFVCKVCPKAFCRKDNMDRHMKTTHKQPTATRPYRARQTPNTCEVTQEVNEQLSPTIAVCAPLPEGKIQTKNDNPGLILPPKKRWTLGDVNPNMGISPSFTTTREDVDLGRYTSPPPTPFS